MTEQTLLFDDELMAAGFTQVPNAILENGDITPQAKVLYLLLLRFAWQENHAFPGQETLCRMMGFTSDNTVRKYLNELKKLNLVSWEQRGLSKTNVYTIITRTITRLEPQAREVQEPQASGFPTIKNTQKKNTQKESPIINKEKEETPTGGGEATTSETEALTEWLQAKQERKANKGKWRKQPFQKPSATVTRGTIADSLHDNLPPEAIEAMSKRLKVLKKDIVAKKQEYIAWVKSEPKNPNRAGLDMASKVELFVTRALADGSIDHFYTLPEKLKMWADAGYPEEGL